MKYEYGHACLYTDINYQDTTLKTVPVYKQTQAQSVYKQALPVN